MKSMKIRAINHVALHVADVDRSAAFYRDAIGLTPMPRPAFTFPGAWLRIAGRQELHLIGDRSSPVASHHRGTHFALQVDSIDHAEQRIRDAGVDIARKQQRPDGVWQIFVIDPDGHYVELTELSNPPND